MGNFTNVELKEIAKWQKNILFMVLASLVSGALIGVLGVLGFLVQAVVALGCLFCTYKLSEAMRRSPILFCILSLIPYVSLVVLILLVVGASKELQAAGIKVGFLGVSSEELKKLDD